jgi:hypothetical protein
VEVIPVQVDLVAVVQVVPVVVVERKNVFLAAAAVAVATLAVVVEHLLQVV